MAYVIIILGVIAISWFVFKVAGLEKDVETRIENKRITY